MWLYICSFVAYSSYMSLELVHRDYDYAVNGRDESYIDPVTGFSRGRLLEIYDSIKIAVSKNRDKNIKRHMHLVAQDVLLAMNEEPERASAVAESFLRHEEAEEDYNRLLTVEIRGMIDRDHTDEAILAAMNDIHDAGMRDELICLLTERRQKNE